MPRGSGIGSSFTFRNIPEAMSARASARNVPNEPHRAKHACCNLSRRPAEVAKLLPCVADLKQFLDDCLGVLASDAEFTVGQRSTFTQHRLQILQGRQIGPSPEETDRNFLAPHVALIESLMKITWVVALFFEDFHPRIEPLVGVVLVVGHAWAEHIDQ